jgi:hypothetical protein
MALHLSLEGGIDLNLKMEGLIAALAVEVALWAWTESLDHLK